MVEPKKYGFNITTIGGKVHGEVYSLIDNRVQLHETSRFFWAFWRDPDEGDFQHAREWCLNQIRILTEANEQ